MKKLFTFLALAIGLVSCQTEPEGFDVNVGGEQDVNITVSLPESTRAASNQGFDFTNFESNSDYDLRFILEISYNGKVVREVKTSETTSATFPVRLAPNKNYTFTVWADLVNEGSEEDLYYNTANGLSNITFKNWTPNVEARDAYTLSKTINFNAAADLSMELTRPFAKVRVVATDLDKVTAFNLNPTSAVAEYFTAEMYTKFDAVNGSASEAATKKHEFIYTNVDTYSDVTGQFTVFADYVFVPEDGNVQFTLDILAGTERIKLNNFNTAIPVEANKVTSIVGDVLTEGGNVNITIDGTLEEKETITLVDTATSLQEVIAGIEDGATLYFLFEANPITIDPTNTDDQEYSAYKFDDGWWGTLPGQGQIDFTNDTVATLVVTAEIKGIVAERGFAIHGHGFNVKKVSLSPIEILPTKVENVAIKNDGIRYNLMGQIVDESYKGIIILNGRKMIVR